MILTVELPHVRAICKDGGFYAFPVEQHVPLLAAWQGGQAFYSGLDAWGEPLCVKLADVVCVMRRTAEGLALVADEDRERKRRETFEGAA